MEWTTHREGGGVGGLIFNISEYHLEGRSFKVVF